jgi:hypothetical protein
MICELTIIANCRRPFTNECILICPHTKEKPIDKYKCCYMCNVDDIECSKISKCKPMDSFIKFMIRNKIRRDINDK